jgi:DNA-binding transcriptional LysR family regulator
MGCASNVGKTHHRGNGAHRKWVLRHVQNGSGLRGYHCRMRDLQFDDMHLFARVAELGTLSAVARERDVPVSQVSRSLSRIEKACGARLIHRSTHGLSLTPEGQTFRDYCVRMIDTLDELEGEFAGKSADVAGLVRVAASTVIAQYQVVPSLAGLAARHPRLRIELEVGDRLLDMARDGVDIAIRTVSNLPGTVIARQIGTLGRGLYASPAYAAAHGLPKNIDALLEHRLITNNTVTTLNQWPFRVSGKPRVVTAEGHWRTNDTNMAATMVLNGLGIGRLATLVGDVLVQQGLLVPVLPNCVDPQPSPVYAVTAGTRHRLPKIKACVDYWAEWFAGNSGRESAKAA